MFKRCWIRWTQLSPSCPFSFRRGIHRENKVVRKELYRLVPSYYCMLAAVVYVTETCLTKKNSFATFCITRFTAGFLNVSSRIGCYTNEYQKNLSPNYMESDTKERFWAKFNFHLPLMNIRKTYLRVIWNPIPNDGLKQNLNSAYHPP